MLEIRREKERKIERDRETYSNVLEIEIRKWQLTPKPYQWTFERKKQDLSEPFQWTFT